MNFRLSYYCPKPGHRSYYLLSLPFPAAGSSRGDPAYVKAVLESVFRLLRGQPFLEPFDVCRNERVSVSIHKIDILLGYFIAKVRPIYFDPIVLLHNT